MALFIALNEKLKDPLVEVDSEVREKAVEAVLPGERLKVLFAKYTDGSIKIVLSIKLEVVYAPGYCDDGHWTNQIENNFDPYGDYDRVE